MYACVPGVFLVPTGPKEAIGFTTIGVIDVVSHPKSAGLNLSPGRTANAFNRRAIFPAPISYLLKTFGMHF